MRCNLVRKETRSRLRKQFRARQLTFELRFVYVRAFENMCTKRKRERVHVGISARTFKVSGHLDLVSTWFPDYVGALTFVLEQLSSNDSNSGCARERFVKNLKYFSPACCSYFGQKVAPKVVVNMCIITIIMNLLCLIYVSAKVQYNYILYCICNAYVMKFCCANHQNIKVKRIFNLFHF